jgi:sugar (pentulose or hexulose) kinase
MAGDSTPLVSFIDTTDPTFVPPDDMPGKVAGYCRDTHQPVPSSAGEIARCVFDSLAMSYRRTVDQLEEVTSERITTLYIVGGGSQNVLLNQLSANALGRDIVAGPVECTAIGNVIVQAITLGDIPSLSAARGIVRNSFPSERYGPRETPVWEEAYRRYHKVIRRHT